MRKWLINLRIASGKSQQQLADESNVDRTYINKLEAGTRNPSVGVAKAIGASLGFGWEKFFEHQCDELGRKEQSATSA